MTDTLKDYVRRQWERDKAQIEREAIDNYIASPEFRDALIRALRSIPVPATYEEWLITVDRSYEDDANHIISALKENK